MIMDMTALGGGVLNRLFFEDAFQEANVSTLSRFWR